MVKGYLAHKRNTTRQQWFRNWSSVQGAGRESERGGGVLGSRERETEGVLGFRERVAEGVLGFRGRERQRECSGSGFRENERQGEC